MLRNLGIRSKILAVLALPVLVLVLAAAVIAGGAAVDARAASQVEKLAGQASGLAQLIRGLQAERSLSLAVLAGDTASAAQLADVRATVDQGLQTVRGKVATVDLTRLDDGAQDGIAASEGAHNRLSGIRSQVDADALSTAAAAQTYATVIGADIALPERIAEAVDDRDLAQQLRAYSATERLAETIAQEIDLGSGGVAAGRYTAALRTELAGVMAKQDFARAAATEAAERLGVRLPTTGEALEQARQRTVRDADGVLDGITVTQWRAAGQADIDALKNGEATLARLAGERSADLAAEAGNRALEVGVLAVLLVVVPLLLALFIARRITTPLRQLTEAAGQLRAQLPQMVDRMHTPGEGPDLTLPDIPVESDDEVGRLAAAFNDVNATTVQVAQEQAALRGSIAAMFVNVARRDQVLLSRQLAFIDQLERAEEDPATLDNLFKLDHLATRMRRNAESLLVLAGIDTGRRLRRPMPLSDVIRTASSEIEHYQRVDLALRDDPPMIGHMALSTAHLLAELLENATRFSDPGSRVVVSTGSNDRGIVVTISDEGLGMSPDEIADANTRIAEPPVSEVVGAQRLGFFVVGRLARKLDATVVLRAGATSGTVVTIELPPALFVPGSVVQIPVVEIPGDGESIPVEDAAGTLVSLPDPAVRDARSSRLFSGFRARQAEAAERRVAAPSPAPAAQQPAATPEPPASVSETTGPALVDRAEQPVAAEPIPAIGAPAVTILPGSGRSRSLRRGRKAPADGPAHRTPAPQPVVPMTPRDRRPFEAVEPATHSGIVAAGSPVPGSETPVAQSRPFAPAAPAVAQSAPFVPAAPASGGPLPTRSRPASPAASGNEEPASEPGTAPPTAGPVLPPPSLFGTSGLPTTSATSAASGTANAPAVEARSVNDGGLRQRSALASEALTELSLLSSYSPSSVNPKPASTLSRRTRGATPGAAVPAPAPVTSANRQARNASDVRSMLSGFQAGVERGRTAPGADQTGPAGE